MSIGYIIFNIYLASQIISLFFNNRRRWREWESTPVNYLVVVETKFFFIKFSVMD